MANRPNRSNWEVLKLGGGFTAVFSLAMSLLLLFVVPGACSFLAGLEIIMLGLLFLAGAAVYVLGFVLHRRIS